MRIAQVAPLSERVPPKCYGGTERIVSGVTEELVRRGHEVVLFASGDSTTAAELIACCPQGLRLDRGVQKAVFRVAARIDIFYDELSASDRVIGELHSVLRVHREALTRPLASTLLEESVYLEDSPRIDCYRRTDRIVTPSAQ
jgi:hypothetical protein